MRGGGGRRWQVEVEVAEMETVAARVQVEV